MTDDELKNRILTGIRMGLLELDNSKIQRWFSEHPEALKKYEEEVLSSHENLIYYTKPFLGMKGRNDGSN